MSFNFRYPVIILDLEMSGLDPTENQILEVAALKCDPRNLKILDTFHKLCGEEVGAKYNRVSLSKNKLLEYTQSNEFFNINPPPYKVVPELLNWIPDQSVIVGFNLQLDMLFINRVLHSLGQKTNIFSRKVDLSDLLEFYYASGHLDGPRSLKDICEKLNISSTNAHSSKGDCYMCLKLLSVFTDLLKPNMP